MSVRAFQPRSCDPPKFVAEDLAELEELEGSFIGGGQCDGCGNHSYQVRVRMIAPGTRHFEAVCMTDPDESEEFRHPEPCGNVYSIRIYDDDDVEF